MTIKILAAAAFALSIVSGVPAFAQSSATDTNSQAPMNCGTPGADNVNCKKDGADMSTTGSVVAPAGAMDNMATDGKKDDCTVPGADNVNCQKKP